MWLGVCTMDSTMGRTLVSLLALAILGAACASTSDDAAVDSQDLRGATIPLREVSGLARRGDTFVAIGDRSTALVTFQLDGSKLANVVTHRPLPKAGADGSQFEAVAFDGRGGVVALAETGNLTILDEACENVVGSTDLDWKTAEEMLGVDLDANSLGEGLVVLDASHVLVALEKSPSALVEFGPAGDAPRGFVPDAMAAETAFEPPAKLVALASFRIEDSATPDLSEITVGPDGALWGLSQQGKAIVRFERTLKPTESRATVKRVVPIPGSLVGAEGLSFAGDRPVVARDRSAEKQNLFVLDPIAL